MRSAIVVLALALALAGCASAKHVSPPPPARPVSRNVAAERDPQRLLSLVSLPAGARRAPQLDRGLLAGSIGSLTVSAHRLWRVAEPYGAVLRYFERQQPQGATARSNLLVGRVHMYGKNRQLSWLFRPIPHLISRRMLSVTVLALAKNETGIRIESDDLWTVRPASERIPAGVRAITIRRARWQKEPALSARITKPSDIAQVAGWFEALPLWRGATGDCPAIFFQGPATVVRFLSATGRVLAETKIVGAGTGGACGSGIEVSVRGRAQPPLAGKFLVPVLALAGVKS